MNEHLSQFFVVHGDSIKAGPYVTRAPARAFINRIDKCHARRARSGLPPAVYHPNAADYTVVEAQYELVGQVAHEARPPTRQKKVS